MSQFNLDGGLERELQMGFLGFGRNKNKSQEEKDLQQVAQNTSGMFNRRQVLAGLGILAGAKIAEGIIPDTALAYLTPKDEAQGLMRIMLAGTPAHPLLIETAKFLAKGDKDSIRFAQFNMYPYKKPADFKTFRTPGIPRDLPAHEIRAYIAYFELSKESGDSYANTVTIQNSLGIIPPTVGTPNWLLATSLADDFGRQIIIEDTPNAEPFKNYTREDMMLAALMGGITGDISIDVLKNKMYLRDPKTQETVEKWAQKYNFKPFGDNHDLNSKLAYLSNLTRENKIKNPETVGLTLLGLLNYYDNIGDRNNGTLYFAKLLGALEDKKKIPQYSIIDKKNNKMISPIRFFT